ncbi:unnamed protein product, partial [Rotaria sp. Silwood2]
MTIESNQVTYARLQACFLPRVLRVSNFLRL